MLLRTHKPPKGRFRAGVKYEAPAWNQSPAPMRDYNSFLDPHCAVARSGRTKKQFTAAVGMKAAYEVRSWRHKLGTHKVDGALLSQVISPANPAAVSQEEYARRHARQIKRLRADLYHHDDHDRLRRSLNGGAASRSPIRRRDAPFSPKRGHAQARRRRASSPGKWALPRTRARPSPHGGRPSSAFGPSSPVPDTSLAAAARLNLASTAGSSTLDAERDPLSQSAPILRGIPHEVLPETPTLDATFTNVDRGEPYPPTSTAITLALVGTTKALCHVIVTATTTISDVRRACARCKAVPRCFQFLFSDNAVMRPNEERRVFAAPFTDVLWIREISSRSPTVPVGSGRHAAARLRQSSGTKSSGTLRRAGVRRGRDARATADRRRALYDGMSPEARMAIKIQVCVRCVCAACMQVRTLRAWRSHTCCLCTVGCIPGSCSAQ